MRAQIASIARHVQAKNFARLARHRHLERTAAHLAIRREPLIRHARVNGHLGGLPAKRTGNGFANFHAQNLNEVEQSAMAQTERSSVSRSTSEFFNNAIIQS